MSKINLEILAYEHTPLGLLFLRRRELLSQPGTFVTEVTLNHEFLMSSLYTKSERVLAEHALEMHTGQDLNVLVGGLGLGYTAQEALKSERVSQLEVIEFLPQVIRWTQEGLIPLSTELNNESRLTLTCGDVFQRMLNPPTKQFDLILIDVDHSPEERLADANISFYSLPGLQAVQKHLQPGGILAVWSYAEDSPFAEALRRVFQEVSVVPVTYRNELINEKRTDWLFFAKGP